ncbi:hypothetical protein METH_21480 (plasmid) [Leisingera methylohalidivorans DSM 14336]|uniref:Uncharacterized protein n=1 Tax=Leisingera methylohalidivorans DSM 14336 TaxID=999552 RepID=V9W044_9RHOB|nr:hypothetical protein METH_21480 [Leisingera methylohalidivorans DSM 14336]
MSDAAPRIRGGGAEFAKVFGCHLVARQVKQVCNGVRKAASALHPVVRACFAFHLWPMAGIGPGGGSLEGAVIAARISAGAGQGGALFAPVPVSGAGGCAV